MTACDLVAAWESLGLDERLDQLKALINDLLDEAGYDAVTVGVDQLTNAVGEYRNAANEVFFDRDYLGRTDPFDAIDTAFHEAAHAMEAQDGDMSLLSDAETEQYNDLWWALDESDPYSFTTNDFHQDIFDYAAYMTDQALRDCRSAGEPPAGEVYAAGGDLTIEADWEAAVVTDAPPEPEIEFEIDEEHAIVTPE